MISQIGKVGIEVINIIDVVRKVEEEGKIVEKPDKIALRFDFNMPMGTSYDMVYEVLKEMKEEVEKMEEASKKRAEELKKENEDIEELEKEDIEPEILS